jgi:hypothetical protein
MIDLVFIFLASQLTSSCEIVILFLTTKPDVINSYFEFVLYPYKL